MTSWRDIQNEIASTRSEKNPAGDFDRVRREKYKKVSELTGRPLIVYATAFHHPIKAQIAAPFLGIDLSDKEGFEEVVQTIHSKSVDVFLHSPGGSAEAVESIVQILRNKFSDVRFIITGAAKSAATMLALSGNSIVMNKSAEVGPTDPQVRIGDHYAPAGSIIEQFDKATKVLQEHPEQLPVWVPILREFAPALLVQCENFIALSRTLVATWLAQYMFAGESDVKGKAEKVATYLADEKNFLSHARRIDYATLRDLGVRVLLVEDQEEKLQSAMRELHLIIMATLDNTATVKMFENSEGAVLIRAVQQIVPVNK